MTENNPKMTELRIQIRTDVLKDFKEFVTNKYGKLHAVLSIEVERALELYPQIQSAHIDINSSTHNGTIKEDKTDKDKEKIDCSTDNNLLYGDMEVQPDPNNGQSKQRSIFFTNIIEMREHFEKALQMDSTFEFHPLTVKKYIRDHIGGDDRTVKKYVDALKPYLKPANGTYVTFDYAKFDTEWV